MAQLDQDIPANNPDIAAEEFPSSPELFCDQEFSEHDARLKTEPSSQENSLFPDQITHTPTRTKRTHGKKKVNCPPVWNISSDDSSDYEPPPKKLSLKEILENHFHNKKKLGKKRRTKKSLKRKGRKNRYLRYLHPEKQQRTATIIRTPNYTLPLGQRKRRMLHRGIKFPFTSRKYLPLRLGLSYEQSVLGGFLSYVKKIKYWTHLKRSLNNMGEAESMDEENFLSRNHGFLDEEESISPISESGDDEHETEDHDAVIVENDSFILDCNIPSKKEWQIKKRKKQSTKKRKKEQSVAED